MTLQASVRSDYDETYYDEIDDAGVPSARVIVPLLIDLFSPVSVCDVGCGRGGWLQVFLNHGVSEVQGFDSPVGIQDRLLIDRSLLQTVDLSRPFELHRQVDIAMCLEVAEHLPESASQTLVRQLTESAPVVIFSAAIPGQMGTHHINEQWHEYWHWLFEQQGYWRYDIIRPQIFGDKRVAWWYRQNIFVYASRDAASRFKLDQLAARYDDYLTPVARHVLEQFTSTRALTKAAGVAVLGSIHRKLRRCWSAIWRKRGE